MKNEITILLKITKVVEGKYMIDSLKTNYLFIGPHLTVNEVCH